MFELKFDTDNAAFDDGADSAEIARILSEVSQRVEQGWLSSLIMDANGNVIGSWSYVKREAEDLL